MRMGNVEVDKLNENLENIGEQLSRIANTLEDLSEGDYENPTKPFDRIVKHLDDIDPRLFDIKGKIE